MLTFECFASVVPNHKLLSAQLSKTLVKHRFLNRYNMENIILNTLFFIVLFLVLLLLFNADMTDD